MYKTVNVLNTLPKVSQAKAQQLLHTIWQAETSRDTEKAFGLFIDDHEVKYPKAT